MQAERPIPGPVVLVVLDGWGLDETHEHNGVAQAQTPNFDTLSKTHPYTTLQASGEHVGLPEGQMGNSEVGHTTIGAGTIIYQDLVRISKDAKEGMLAQNVALKQAFAHNQTYNSQLHIIGLLSTGGVHSHEDHLFETACAAHKAGVKRILIHAILDGRDAPPNAGTHSLARLEKVCQELGNCFIASVSGRYYSMDRDKNWDRTDKAFRALWFGEADFCLKHDQHPSEAVREFYGRGLSDEHIEPIVLKQGHSDTSAKVEMNDSIIFTNFRTDRTKQLSHKIGELIEDMNLCFVTMTHYGNEIKSIVAYEPATIEHTIASVVANAGLKQAHIAETEKYPHATYFLNGGKQDAHTNEEHVLIPSRKDVKTHDEAPEMKAKEIADAAIERVTTNDFIFINFANPDMVGHTANKAAIITAVETVDRELQRVVNATLKANGALLIIADHGNAERMVDPETGAPHTAHTTNPVPCILVAKNYRPELIKGGGLKDIAPTILVLLGLEIPNSMTGQPLAN